MIRVLFVSPWTSLIPPLPFECPPGLGVQLLIFKLRIIVQFFDDISRYLCAVCCNFMVLASFCVFLFFLAHASDNQYHTKKILHKNRFRLFQVLYQMFINLTSQIESVQYTKFSLIQL